MTLSVTSLTNGSIAPGTNLTGYATASVSPAGGSLLVLSSGAYDGAGAQDFTIASVSGLSLTWAKQKATGAGSADKGDVEVWTAVCGASPGSGAITVTFTAGAAGLGGAAWAVDQATGQNATTPIVTPNTQAANASSTDAAVTFSTAGSAGNLFLMMSVVLLGATGTVTQTPVAWTALDNLQSSTATNNGVGLLTQVSPDATNVDGAASLNASHSWGAIGLELAAASGGANVSAQLAGALAAPAPAVHGAETISGRAAAAAARPALGAHGTVRQNVSGALAAAAAPPALRAGRRRRSGLLVFTRSL